MGDMSIDGLCNNLVLVKCHKRMSSMDCVKRTGPNRQKPLTSSKENHWPANIDLPHFHELSKLLNPEAVTK